MAKTPDLLPCPFCGSTDVGVGRIDYTRNKSVVCSGCGAEGPPSTMNGKAILLWNRRASPEEK